VLRLRPLQKRERDDPVLLEPLPSTAATVILHPPPPKQGDLLSPSSELVRQTIDPAGTIPQDVDFRLDHVWSVEATQDKIYFDVGLPMALAAMEPLKAEVTASSATSSVGYLTNNLLVAMGTAGSGKSYTCWGGAPIHNKRKQEADGLAPRIVDSMYSQSKHHICSVSKRSVSFAVNISILLVKQHMSKPDAGTIHDLLQPVASRTMSIASSVSSLSMSSVGKSPIIQNIKSVHAGGPLKKAASGGTSTLNSSNYSTLDEPVFVEQDADADFHVVNGQVRTCRSNEEAREALHTAMTGAYRLSTKRHHSYVLIKLQPVLMDKAGTNVVRTGGTIAVLDMAGYSGPSATSQTSNRAKESVPTTRDDAQTALLRCLRTIQENESIRAGQRVQNSDDSEDDTSSRMERALSLRKVPYRQHKLTMLLQPVLAENRSGKTLITLFVTAYPGHRDYAGKKSLLNELQAFHKTAHCQEPVTTGLKSNPPRKKDRKTTKTVKAHHQHRKTSCTAQASDADDEVSIEGPPKAKSLSPMQVLTDFSVENPVAVAPGICNYVSSSYSSDDPYDDPTAVVAPLPPPVAPSYEILVRASLSSSVLSPEASAPVEPKVPSYERIDYTVPSNRKVALSDFPGVDFLTPTNGQISSFCSEESTPPCPPASTGTAPTAQAHRMGPKETPGYDTQGIDRVFSPMKTFNKVVHASKKKGQQVLDKMSKISSDSYGAEMWGVDSAQRIMSLEGNNKRLLKENEDLRTANERLLQEKEELLKRLMNSEQDNSDADPDLDVACIDASDRDEAGDRSSLVEDSLLEHMAVIGGYRLGSPSNEEKWRPQSSQLSRSILQNYQAKFQHGV
jgi:Kinesin motor domain